MQSRACESAANRFLSQFLCGTNPVVVGLTPGSHLHILFFRKSKEAPIDADMFMQTPQHVRVLNLIAPVFLQGLQQHLLGVVMLRERTGSASDSHSYSFLPAPMLQCMGNWMQIKLAKMLIRGVKV